MTWNDYEADVLARLEEDIEEHDPDLAMQFLALAHPALRGPLPTAPSAARSRLAKWFPICMAVMVIACAPGVLFGAWTVVSAITVIGGMVLGLAGLGTLIAEKGDRTPASR